MLTRLTAGFVLMAAGLFGQAVDLTFNYRTSASPTVLDVPPNGQVSLPAIAVGSTSSATMVITNRGAVTYNLTTVSTNSSAFKASAVGQVTMPPAGSGAVSITFTPTVRGAAGDTMSLVFTNSNGLTFVVTFFLTGTGQSADLLTSYLLPGGNQTAVGSGATIAFPGTVALQTTAATFIVANRGNAEGTLRSVSVSGAGYTVSGLPLLPATLAPNTDLRFTVQFRPETIGPATGALQMELSDGVRIFNLQGNGTGPSLALEVNLDGTFVRVTPGTVIKLADTEVNGRLNVPARIRNEGTSEGRITGVAAVGDAYRTQDLVPLPATLPAQGVLNFTLVFSPTLSGASAGRLLVNESVYDLNGLGVGARLTFSSEIGGVATPVPSTNLIILPNTTVGVRLTARIVVLNDGNANANINGANLAGSQFSLSGLPAFPATLRPGESLSFNVVFLPNAVGIVNGSLQIDERTFTVRGSAGAPPPLPAVQITNLAETAESLQQPSVGLRIAETYATEVTGKLNLGFTAESFGDDTSIQFATGGRSVDFRIPANSRDAIFGDNATQVQFQTGTVAGTIAVSASFTVGAADVTPAPAPTRSVAIAATAPRIRSLQIGARSATTFEVLITGYSPTRELTQLSLQFAAPAGSNLTTTSLTVNADSAFGSWYQGTASRPFGSQFTASLSINVNGDINAVQSVSVTGTNSKGASNSMSVNLR